jgi:UDP-2-acetamido-3-amino-2,3-dideoxy-glucuronate N-acetyltransferase
MPHHVSSIIESSRIDSSSNIRAFVHILSGAVIGAECNIYSGVFVDSNVIVGDRVTINCGVQLWSGLRLQNDVFVGPNATFTNDIFSRRHGHIKSVPETLICEGANIGANATIFSGITIGRRAMISAGAVVTKSVPPFAIVEGNPGRIIGYANAGLRSDAQAAVFIPTEPGATFLSVRGVTIHRFKSVHDLRGDLAVANFEREIPFMPKRQFLVYHVPSTELRGEHAHYKCHQFLIAAHGSLAVMVDDGHQRQEVFLESPDQGLYLPPLTWGVQYKYSCDAVLLVYASHIYDASDYIRDYDTFIAAVGQEIQ